ncbi:hypothetical protein BDR05DRAFT_881347, partial [Suillus weaverae]
HVFKCIFKGCKVKICHFLDKKDTYSIENMRKHVKICWRDEIFQVADQSRNAKEVHSNFVNHFIIISLPLNTSPNAFLTFPLLSHTIVLLRAEIVCWVCENLQPFEIIKDRGFQSLIKMRRLEYYLLSPSTVFQDIRLVFAKTEQQIAKISIEYDGKLNFSTNGWTSPNLCVYVALLMHLEHKGIPLCIPLDIVEVPKVHVLTVQTAGHLTNHH